jgi:hypothetical protein
MTQDQVTPQLYAAVFEVDKRGAAILEDLVRRFTLPAVISGGIDAVLQTYLRQGQQSVINHILLQINRANGVPDPNEE